MHRSMKSTVAHHRPHLLKALEDRYSAAGPLSLQNLRGLWKRNAWYGTIVLARILKRSIDILGASVGLLVLSPVFLIVACAIGLHDRGPIFFVQKRVGQWGREFDFPKFRSMVCNAEALKEQLLSQNHHKDGVTFKINGDPRVTPIGRWLRKTSIDELPRLLRGTIDIEEQRAWVGFYRRVGRDVALAAEVMAQLDEVRREVAVLHCRADELPVAGWRNDIYVRERLTERFTLLHAPAPGAVAYTRARPSPSTATAASSSTPRPISGRCAIDSALATKAIRRPRRRQRRGRQA